MADSFHEVGGYGITGVNLTANAADATLKLASNSGPFASAEVSLLSGSQGGQAVIIAFKSSLRFRPHLLPHVVAFLPHASYVTCRKGPGAQARDDGENGARGLLRRLGGAAIHCLLVCQGRVRGRLRTLAVVAAGIGLGIRGGVRRTRG